jgi:hypothetical protein
MKAKLDALIAEAEKAVALSYNHRLLQSLIHLRQARQALERIEDQ